MIFSIDLQISLKKMRNSFSEMLKLVFKMLKLLRPTFSLQGLGWMSHKKSL